MRVCGCVCECVRVRACVCACVRACVRARVCVSCDHRAGMSIQRAFGSEPDFTGHYRILQDIAGFYRTLQDFTGRYIFHEILERLAGVAVAPAAPEAAQPQLFSISVCLISRPKAASVARGARSGAAPDGGHCSPLLEPCRAFSSSRRLEKAREALGAADENLFSCPKRRRRFWLEQLDQRSFARRFIACTPYLY